MTAESYKVITIFGDLLFFGGGFLQLHLLAVSTVGHLFVFTLLNRLRISLSTPVSEVFPFPSTPAAFFFFFFADLPQVLLLIHF